MNKNNKEQSASGDCRERAMKWAIDNTAWRILGDGRICIRPKDLVKTLDRLEAAEALLKECQRYVEAMEDHAAESLGIHDLSQRSKAGIEKRLQIFFSHNSPVLTRSDEGAES